MSDIKDLPKWEPGSLAYLVERYGDTELGELAEIVASKDAEITKLREENERLTAVCDEAVFWNHSVRVCNNHTTEIVSHDMISGDCVICENDNLLSRLAAAEGKVERVRKCVDILDSHFPDTPAYRELKQILK